MPPLLPNVDVLRRPDTPLCRLRLYSTTDYFNSSGACAALLPPLQRMPGSRKQRHSAPLLAPVWEHSPMFLDSVPHAIGRGRSLCQVYSFNFIFTVRIQSPLPTHLHNSHSSITYRGTWLASFEPPHPSATVCETVAPPCRVCVEHRVFVQGLNQSNKFFIFEHC